MTTTQEAVIRYYSSLESRLGYRFIMGRSQHAGLYDSKHSTEPLAQLNYNQKIADLLELRPNMKVLDAGCGQGEVASFIASQNNVDIMGITIVPYEIRSAQKVARQRGVSARVHFQLGDYSDPPFSDEYFDRIYTTESLSHAPDVQKVTDTFWRLLKKGGMLVCAEYEFDYSKFDEEDHRDAERVIKYAGINGIYKFGMKEFPQHLITSGFTLAQEYDWTDGVASSYRRLARLAKPFKSVVKRLHLERFLINAAVADTYIRGIERRGLFYKVYIARKP